MNFVSGQPQVSAAARSIARMRGSRPSDPAATDPAATVSVAEVRRWLDATRDADPVENSPLEFVGDLVAEPVELRDLETPGCRLGTLGEEIALLGHVAVDDLDDLDDLDGQSGGAAGRW